MVTIDGLQILLEHFAEVEGPQIQDILKPRISGGLNDVLIAYYSSLLSEPEEELELNETIDSLCIALDIVMRNHHIPLDHRKTVVLHLRELCIKEPELIGLSDDASRVSERQI